MDISNIDAGKEGINVVETSLKYDKSIFESVEFEKQNNWNTEYNNISGHSKQDKLLLFKMTSGVKEDEEIGKIKLKLRKNLGSLETEIKLLQVTSNDGRELINEGDRVIKIKILGNETSNNTITDENTDMPKTGQQRVVYIALGVIIVGCVGVLIYLKFKNKKKDK